MFKEEVEDFAKYELYEIYENKHHTIAIFDNYRTAKSVAILFAMVDPKRDSYCITGISSKNPNELIPGGGWKDEFYVDEDGKLQERGLA